MKKNNWRMIRSDLNKAVHQGLHILKEGGEGVWQVAEKTAHLLKTETEIHGLKSDIARLNEQFGSEVHRAMKGGGVRITAVLRKINTQLRKLELQLKKKEGQICKATVTRWPATRKAAKRKKIA